MSFVNSFYKPRMLNNQIRLGILYRGMDPLDGLGPGLLPYWSHDLNQATHAKPTNNARHTKVGRDTWGARTRTFIGVMILIKDLLTSNSQSSFLFIQIALAQPTYTKRPDIKEQRWANWTGSDPGFFFTYY